MTQWSLSHSPLACFMTLCLKLTNQHTHHSISSSKTGPPSSGSTFGAFMQLHKVLILLCICTLAQKFTFLRLGPKTLKDKLFCSFNEVFALLKFWVLVVITWSSGLLCFYKVTPKVYVFALWPKSWGHCILAQMLWLIAFWPKLVENKIVLSL